MRATRRRQRKLDRLASKQAVQSLLDQLRAALPDIIPRDDRDLVRMLRAARHVGRYRAADNGRGRPSPWRREDLLKVTTRLGDLLDRETSSHISFASFVDHYLRLLDFPTDVNEALNSGQINLFEAEQLARITPRRLDISPARAARTRAEVLAAHLQTKASGERLRQRVGEMLRSAGPAPADSNLKGETTDPENLEDFDPYDSTHLFWEQIKQLGFAFREIRREDVTDEEIEELLRASEPFIAILSRIQRRKEQKNAVKLKI